MLNKKEMENLLSKMTDNIHHNIKIITKEFGSIGYEDEDNQKLLHIFVDNLYDEEKCFLAIKTLLEYGLDPNVEDCYHYNFIQTALYTGYSEEFILKIIKEALKYNLDVNHVDDDKDTIMHTAIYSDDYNGGIESIYELLCENGFDSSLRDCTDRNLLEALMFKKNINSSYYDNKNEVDHFKKIFEDNLKKLVKDNNQKNIKKQEPICIKISDKDILELEKYGKVLTNKSYMSSPTIGREKELKNLMITLAQDKKNPIIVGESGVGKTAIVDELAYRIKIGAVPSFLQNKVILEVNPSDVVAGCSYVGQFEANMNNLMKLCEKYDVIVFIDEIHTIYGIGSSENKSNDMASMLKHYIDRTNLKVIGTTTEKEYNEFFSNDALKRRFEKISIKEPIEDILYQILNKVIEDYCIKNGVIFENENIKEEIINIIVNSTEKRKRVYNDMINNPDLSISIIDKAFAFAKVYDSNFITQSHFIESFECCDRIYDSIKESAIESLKNIESNISKPQQKILKFNK